MEDRDYLEKVRMWKNNREGLYNILEVIMYFNRYCLTAKEGFSLIFFPKGSRAASALTAATLTSLGGTSSRRGSGETALTIDAEASIQIKVMLKRQNFLKTEKMFSDSSWFYCEARTGSI